VVPFSVPLPVLRALSPVARLVFAILALPLATSVAQAQAGMLSTVRTVSINATKPNFLTVTVVSGGTQTIASLVDNTINNFPTPVQITTSWDLTPGAASVRMLAYFTTPAQALANGSNFITSSRVEGRVQTLPVTSWQPVTWTAFTMNANSGVGVTGGTLGLFDIPLNAGNQQSSRTFDLELRLRLNGIPSLPGGTYTGTIHLRAFTT
jgi:hypothetical protein